VSKTNTAISKIAKQTLFYVCLILAWQLVFWLGTEVLTIWKPYAFPNPWGVWLSLGRMINQQTLGPAVAHSLQRALIGYLYAVALGAVVGLLLSRSKTVSTLLKPLILGIQSLPSVCWVPFAILWFGLTESSIIFVIVIGSAFSITIAVEAGIRNVPPLYIRAARTMGAEGVLLYWRVILPASLPSLLTGLKQGWSFAWRALMSAEVMSATIGLGQALMMGRDLADINRVMLVIILIIIIGMLIEKFVFSIVEERVLRRIGLGG
jgi:NitT/TauT family transport system permease protein